MAAIFNPDEAGPEKGLVKGTNWWGAFVIGLAGTILVTGIAPYVVEGTGALGIILMGVMTVAGCFLCLCLAELATIWPDRTGGIPSFATESFRPLVGEKAARHIGGTSGWAYWLGWAYVAGFHTAAGVPLSLAFICAWFFPILWNVIAMEAAACYVGECRGGARDAKIALTAEGIFGMFIYIATPLVFVAVLGLALSTADPLTLYVTYTEKIFGAGSWVKWFVGIPLIAALALSVLNAIMGCGRSLYQAAEDGLLPRFF